MKTFIKKSSLIGSAIAGVFAVSSGLAFAGAGSTNWGNSMGTTGPWSRNSTVSNNSQRCEITNNNNVSVRNNVRQNANSGNASVGSDWNQWSPIVWRAKGYSYDEWQRAFHDHMMNKTYEGVWGDNHSHSGGNTNGGSAMSGNAQNDSQNDAAIDIQNAGCMMGVGSNGDPDDSHNHNGNMNNTGPNSRNTFMSHNQNTTTVNNSNRVGVENNTWQSAMTGSARVSGNTNGGSAMSGNAQNSSMNQTDVHITNQPVMSGQSGGGSWGGNGGANASIHETGPNSHNSISFNNQSSTTVTNTNVVDVANQNYQTAVSGNATVSGNTNGGNATTGNAANTASNNTSISITN